MARDIPELPVDESGNGERLGTLRFDLADAPVLMHALMVQGNLAMMGCGGPKVEGRMRHYQRIFLEACPKGYEHLRRDEDLCDIAIAMVESETWSIHRKRRWQSSTEGPSVITVGSKRWETSTLEIADHDELAACIQAIAPLDCRRTERADELQNNW